MGYLLTSVTGGLEAVIDDNCGMKKFISIANLLVKECRIRFIAKEDYSDSIDWYFRYKRRTFKLHYSIYNGASISTESSKDNSIVSELAALLQQKFY